MIHKSQVFRSCNSAKKKSIPILQGGPVHSIYVVRMDKSNTQGTLVVGDINNNILKEYWT